MMLGEERGGHICCGLSRAGTFPPNHSCARRSDFTPGARCEAGTHLPVIARRLAAAAMIVAVTASACVREGLNENGRPAKISPTWTSADPEMVTVSPPEGSEVKISVKQRRREQRGSEFWRDLQEAVGQGLDFPEQSLAGRDRAAGRRRASWALKFAARQPHRRDMVPAPSHSLPGRHHSWPAASMRYWLDVYKPPAF